MNKYGFSLIDEPSNFGLKNMQLRLVTDHEDMVICYETLGENFGEATVGEQLKVRTEVSPVNGLEAITVFHSLTNISPKPLRLLLAETGQFAEDAAVLPGTGHALGWEHRFAHTDNLRTERYPYCQMEYPFLRMLPVEQRELGLGEDQSYPALYLRDNDSARGLYIAAASQELNYLTFTLKKAALCKTSMFETFKIGHDFAQTDGLTIAPGQSVVLDGLFIQLTGDLNINDLGRDYANFLAERHDFRGPKTTLLTEAMHCTWNYRKLGDQRYEPLMETARFIAENLPGIRYYLMDAGYLDGNIGTTFLDNFYPEPNAHVRDDMFPGGIRKFSDDLRALGLKPGIWWSPTTQLNSNIYRDHPDWFLRKDDGEIFRIGEQNGFLDYSNPEAMDYLDRTLAVILGEWGMDACKMDFWSQNFEARNIRWADPNVTAVQMRTRFFQTVRKYLPDDGVFMTCVATGMGNPFIGQHADCYRNTIDIGVGKWHEQKWNCFWSLPTLTRSGKTTYLLNNDSVGAHLNSTDDENYFRFTWSFMHQGMIETGGDMEKWPTKFVEAMRRCTEHVDRGHPVKCLDLAAFTGEPLPKVLMIDYPENSATYQRGVAKHIALFNWNDVSQVIGASGEQIGLNGEITVRNFWTDEIQTFPASGISETLKPHSARLYEIAR